MVYKKHWGPPIRECVWLQDHTRRKARLFSSKLFFLKNLLGFIYISFFIHVILFPALLRDLQIILKICFAIIAATNGEIYIFLKNQWCTCYKVIFQEKPVIAGSSRNHCHTVSGNSLRYLPSFLGFPWSMEHVISQHTNAEHSHVLAPQTSH